jgi:hypothetical protein
LNEKKATRENRRNLIGMLQKNKIRSGPLS